MINVIPLIHLITLPNLIFLLLASLCSFLFIFTSYHHHHHHHRTTSKPPTYGPPSYPIIGCLISFYKNRSRLLNWYTSLLSQSPTQTIVVNRIGAGRIIVTANPDNVEYILKTNFLNYPKGKPFTELIGDLLGCGIFNADGELWAKQRKIASHEFSTRSIKEFVVSVLEEEVGNRLVPLLEKAADEDRIIDLQDVMKRFTYDTICKVSLGTDPNCLDYSHPPPPLLTAFETAAAICARRAAAPLYLIWKLKRFFNIGTEKQLQSSVKTVHQAINQIISDKQTQLLSSSSSSTTASINSDLLSRILSAGHSGDIVRDMLMSFIMAGRDTTASAMTWLFWLLTCNRTVERELIDEVTRVVDEKGGCDETNSPRPLDYEALKEMKYTYACLCECMRLYPPVVWDSKHADKDDVLPDGTRVSAGTRVTFFPYGMGRMEKLWGEDRFEFKPDRWFDDGTGRGGGGESESSGSDVSGKGLKSVSPFVYPVFQAGPRVCLGKEMAFMQMKYVVASLVKRFEFEPVRVEEPVFLPLLTAHMMGGFKVKVKRRENV